jgi:hypothetical protein
MSDLEEKRFNRAIGPRSEYDHHTDRVKVLVEMSAEIAYTRQKIAELIRRVKIITELQARITSDHTVSYHRVGEYILSQGCQVFENRRLMGTVDFTSIDSILNPAVEDLEFMYAEDDGTAAFRNRLHQAYTYGDLVLVKKT